MCVELPIIYFPCQRAYLLEKVMGIFSKTQLFEAVLLGQLLCGVVFNVGAFQFGGQICLHYCRAEIHARINQLIINQ